MFSAEQTVPLLLLYFYAVWHHCPCFFFPLTIYFESVLAGVGVGTLLIALTVRILVTYICVLCAGFSVREKVFIALAWMPKATVQVRLPRRFHMCDRFPRPPGEETQFFPRPAGGDWLHGPGHGRGP